jgi:hypothetical protein
MWGHEMQHVCMSLYSYVLGYGLDVRKTPVGGAQSFLFQCIQTGYEVHPVSQPVGTRCSFSGGKAAGV